MKNQYFGDVNDYAKYGILRSLQSESTIATSVCWALTPDDTRSDGSRTSYLTDPEKWHQYDPVLFEGLKQTVLDEGNRSLAALEASNLLDRSRFWDEFMPADSPTRSSFLERYLEFSSGADLVFLDPDNGLEVKSNPVGSRGSSRYFYLEEVKQVWDRGHSILIYQHFPRVARQPYARRRVRELDRLTGLDRVVAFSTSHVLFLLAPQRCHWRALRRGVVKFAQRWKGAVAVAEYFRDRRIDLGSGDFDAPDGRGLTPNRELGVDRLGLSAGRSEILT